MPAWSDLASDALEHVTSFLALADQHRFSAICHNWRSVAKRKRHPPAPQLPWLVLGEDEKTKKRNFFNLSEQRLYSIDIPELYGHFIVSSSYGWLFTVDKWINGHLVNPFTKESFELAPFPPFFDDDEDMTMTYGDERILNSDGVCIALPYKEVQTRIVFKAVLSHDPKENPDFTVIILFNELRTPAIWRPGDTVWTIIDMGTCHPDPISDVIWFEGNFYANSMSDIIFALDMVGSDAEGTKKYSLESFSTGTYWCYLVHYKGNLLVIPRFKDGFDKTQGFLAARINLKEEAVDELEDIDDLALFVGNSSPLVVDPRGLPGCIPNGIYFTDVSSCYYWRNGGHDFGVYDMDEDAVKPFCPDNDAFSPPEAALLWFTPNP